MEEKKFNPEKHVFVPRHIKLTEDEKKEFLEANNLSKSQIPKITKEDAAIKALEPKKGDLIKIMRNSPTTGQATFYRIVN